MPSHIKSNRFSKSHATAFAAIMLLTGCMQEVASKEYTSTVDGYETSVAMNNVASLQRIAPSAGRASATDVPVIINNPFNGPAAGYAPVNNAYGSLANNNGVVQSGVFMQNSAQVYQQPSSFGSNYYSPAGR